MIGCKFNADESNRIMLHVAWLRKPRSLHRHAITCTLHSSDQSNNKKNDKMTFKDRKLSVVVRYRTNTRQIWQAMEFKSEDKSHQTIKDRPTSKEMTHVIHRRVMSATITYNCMSQSPLPAHIVLLQLPKKRLLRPLAQQTASQYSPGPRRHSGLCGHSAALHCSGFANSLMTLGMSLSASLQKRIFPQWQCTSTKYNLNTMVSLFAPERLTSLLAPRTLHQSPCFPQELLSLGLAAWPTQGGFKSLASPTLSQPFCHCLFPFAN